MHTKDRVSLVSDVQNWFKQIQAAVLRGYFTGSKMSAVDDECVSHNIFKYGFLANQPGNNAHVGCAEIC